MKYRPISVRILRLFPALVLASSLVAPADLMAFMACTPAKCGTVSGSVDIWCCGTRCAAFEQVSGAAHGIYLGEVDGC